MGADECVWVRWDAGGTGGRKNKVNRDKNDRAGYIFGPVVGEISPNIMFCGDRQKLSRMGAEVYKWVRMGVVGCRGTKGTKNNRKKSVNGRAVLILRYMSG